jgi:hypothetical protein
MQTYKLKKNSISIRKLYYPITTNNMDISVQIEKLLELSDQHP